MSDKKRLYGIIAVALIFVILMAVGKFVFDKSKQKEEDEIEITTVATREITTSDNGQSYTYIDENGVKYLVKEDGMYRINNDGTYTFLNEFVNIPIFQTIEFKNVNGYSKEYNFNKDGTYSSTELFSNLKTVSNGKFEVQNGLDAATSALGKNNNMDDLAEELEIDKDNINVNNIYVVTMYYGTGVSYDENGNQIQEDAVDYEDENNGETINYQEMVMAKYVIYLEPNGKPVSKDDYLEYSITGRAVETVSGFYYIDTNSEEAHNSMTVKTNYKLYKSN